MNTNQQLVEYEILSILPFLKNNNIDIVIEKVEQINALLQQLNFNTVLIDIHDFCLRTSLLEFDNLATKYFIENINCFKQEERENILFDLKIRQLIKHHQHNDINQYEILYDFVDTYIKNFQKLNFYQQASILRIVVFYKDMSLVQQLKTYIERDGN